ncbi:hypothetical protein V1286_000748 [Bradyrhizobium algeriense]|uniref:Uncharacterized protein n=1 Tax=Bradyrhizobium algeriense TaxID=634784 RepID=A0ABU8B3W2_9BRAD
MIPDVQIFPEVKYTQPCITPPPARDQSLKSLSSEQKSKETMRFDGFRYGSRIDLVPSETPERYRPTQNQQSPQERYETSNRRRSAANTQVDRTICSQKCKLLRATSCTAYGPPLASALAHALRSPLFRARLSHTNCSHGGSERSSSSALAICLYRFRVTSKSCATTLLSAESAGAFRRVGLSRAKVSPIAEVSLCYRESRLMTRVALGMKARLFARKP